MIARVAKHEAAPLRAVRETLGQRNTESRLPRELDQLPIGHLQLSRAGEKIASEYKTVGALVDGFFDEREEFAALGTKSDLNHVISLLLHCVGKEGVRGWDTFRRALPALANPKAVFFFSPRLQRANRRRDSLALATLHLNRRAIHALEEVKIATVGKLVASARAGIVDVRGTGHATCIEIIESLDALAQAVAEDGSVDWIAYARTRRFRVIPDEGQPQFSAGAFLREFPKACQYAVDSRFGGTALRIFEQRLLTHRDIRASLAELGERCGVTGERARMLEAEGIQMLSRAIFQDEYLGCRFRFRPEFLRPIRELAERVQAATPGSLSVSAWERLVWNLWGVDPELVREQETLIFALLGVQAHFVQTSPVLLGSDDKARFARDAIPKIERLFKAAPNAVLSVQEVRERLGNTRHGGPQQQQLRRLLDSSPVTEKSPSHRGYRLRIECMYSSADCYERILRDHGAPMHFRQIWAEISRLLPDRYAAVSASAVSQRLSESGRFVPVGRSGTWALAEWTHVETRSVPNIAAEMIAAAGAPIAEADLFQAIRRLRPVRRRSIATLLRDDGRFRRVAPCTWALEDAQRLAAGTKS